MTIEETRREKAIKAVSYARQRGLPLYEYSYDEKLKEFEKIKKSKFEQGIKDGQLLQYLHGIGLAWSYFPHHYSIQCLNMKTPLDIYNNDELLIKAFISRLKWGGDKNINDEGYLTDSQFRKAIRTASGVQTVSNFRPSTAATIYHNYVSGNGVVWDMSCGFGGRLFGALASGKVSKYIGTDPSTKTYEGLLNIQKDFSHVGMEIELHKIGSEDFIPNEMVDLCFTSPPYFNTEKYSDEDTQSYKRYQTNIEWNELFLRKTIQNCYQCLNMDGYLILNVANVKTHKTLENDCVRIANEEGFHPVEELKMRLSSLTKGGFKYEPVYIFKKIK